MSTNKVNLVFTSSIIDMFLYEMLVKTGVSTVVSYFLI